MTDLSNAWKAYHAGEFSQAAKRFDHSGGEIALIGKALSLYGMGRADEAIDVASRRAEQENTPRLQAFAADLYGRERHRARAEKMLVQVTSDRPNNGFYRSLLGEQRIRQGKWEEGTSDFIAGLNQPANLAFPHIKLVVTDMVDAVIARRIPRQDAVKFINRIDYSTSNKTQEMDHFFARARRALNANRSMERDDVGEPWSVLLADASTSGTSSSGRQSGGTSSSPPRATSRPPSSSPPTRSEAKQSRSRRRSTKRSQGRAKRNADNPPRGSRNKDRRRPTRGQKKKRQRRGAKSRAREESRSAERQEQRARQDRNQRRLSERPKALQPAQGPAMDAQAKDMTAVMQAERRRNEDLQNLIEQVRPPIWPSQFENPIDVIEPIGFSEKALLPGSQKIETANFRITQGAINVEITLERCMHNLVAAASSVTPTTLPLTKESIPRLELNLLDHFLDSMPRLEDLYRDDTEVDDPRPLAVGKFIGECIVQSYGGVWEHRVPAVDSIIHLGDHTLDPLGLAKKFFTADSFDTVCLRSLIDDAEAAVLSSTAFPRFADYIDPTSGLESEALLMNLAELWVGYRFVLPDMALPAVVDSLAIITSEESYIIFELDAELVPRAMVDEYDGAVDTRRRVKMVYIRESGEFLLLGSRKHLCRFMEVTGMPVSDGTASRIARYIRDYFRPAWNVMVDAKSARKWQKKYETKELKPPAIRKKKGERTLRLHAVDATNSIRKIDIVHRPSQFPPYRMTIH